MKLKELLRDIDIVEMHADPEMDIFGICHDSRLAKESDIFVAVRGYETDGHKYISSAFNKGAAVCLCEEKPDCDIPFVITSDSRRALAQVSRTWFDDPASKMKIIGVTGTNGQTTTTSLVKQIIELISNEKSALSEPFAI